MIEDDRNEDPDNENNLEDHGEDEVELPNPRPQRSRKKPRILTYDTFGGNPTLIHR